MSVAFSSPHEFWDEYTDKLDEEWSSLSKSWSEIFGTKFPAWHLICTMPHKDVYKIIKRSLKTGKDYATPEIEKHPYDPSSLDWVDGVVW